MVEKEFTDGSGNSLVVPIEPFQVGAGNRGTVRKEVIPEIGVRLRYMV